MKQGSFRAIRFIIFMLAALSITVFSASADEVTVNLQSVILDAFDGETTRQWTVGGRTFTHEFEWRADASRFASTVNGQSFPQLSFIQAWPMALFGTNREGRDIRSLGIWGRFDRRGYNWIDVYPVVPGSGGNGDAPVPFEIPIPGRLQSMDMWVWGSSHNIYIEAYFRDYNGVVHSVNMGTISYDGWRNLRIRIPNHIPQSKRTLPRLAGLHFVKFRIWTTPLERVDNFFVYFNQMKILTDVFEALFDGNDLADPERIQEIWASN